MTHPLPSSSIFISIFSIEIFTLAQLGNDFNGQLHLMPSCLPWLLWFPWNHGHLESRREAKGTNSPCDHYVGMKETLLCVYLLFGEGIQDASEAPWESTSVAAKGLHSSGVTARVSTVGSGFSLLSLAWKRGFQPTDLLAAFMSSTSALRCWLLCPTKYFSRVLGSQCSFCSPLYCLLNLRPIQPGTRSLEGTRELSNMQGSWPSCRGLVHM